MGIVSKESRVALIKGKPTSPYLSATSIVSFSVKEGHTEVALELIYSLTVGNKISLQ